MAKKTNIKEAQVIPTAKDLANKRIELNSLKQQLAAGNLKQSHQIRVVRKEIAQMMTIINNQKEQA